MHISRLPTWFIISAHLIPWLLFVILLFTSFFSPETVSIWLVKDSDPWQVKGSGAFGVGIIEHLTVIVLIPGILAGLYAFIKYRNSMKPWWTAYWLLLWTMAGIYFAGEEASWGQWYFGWETPELFYAINDQEETNLHNVSTWFDQKPRTLVELWIFITGLIMPLSNIIRSRLKNTDIVENWIHPVSALVSAGALFFLVRIASWLDHPGLRGLFGNSETRELCIALFLSLFLMSYLVRLSRMKHHSQQ